MSKPYFHEVPQEDIDKLLKTGATWNDIMERYEQPTHCGYYQALSGTLGCWSLVDIVPGGMRTKISPEYCKDCECFISKKPGSEPGPIDDEIQDQKSY